MASLPPVNDPIRTGEDARAWDNSDAVIAMSLVYAALILDAEKEKDQKTRDEAASDLSRCKARARWLVQRGY